MRTTIAEKGVEGEMKLRVKSRSLVLTAVAVTLAWAFPGFAAELPEHRFEVDDTVTPIVRELGPLADGKARWLASILEGSGEQLDFVEDEILVTTDRDEVLADLLDRWQGKVLFSYAPDAAGARTRHLVRINPDLGRLEDLERFMQGIRFTAQDYRLSSQRGLGLLAAVAAEKLTREVDVEAHWVSYDTPLRSEVLDRFLWLREGLENNCGYLLLQEIRLLHELALDGPNSALAEQELQNRIGEVPCAPPQPTFDLIAGASGLVLPEVEAGASFTYILRPPATVPPGFTVGIVGSASGNHVDQAPVGGTLYGGTVHLVSVGGQLALHTQATFVLPQCSRSETFTIRLSHAGGSTDFQVTLPVRLAIAGNFDFTLRPGQGVNVPLCAAGDRGAMTWSWAGIGGDPFPAPSLTIASNPNGTATITGAAQPTSYNTWGSLQVEQGGKRARAGISFQVSVQFDAVLGPLCAATEVLTPDVAFECEMPKPTGYGTHTWTVTSGTLPSGLSLVQQGARWYVRGTVPSSVQLHNVTFELTSPSHGGVLNARQVSFDVQIPFRVWTQNALLRPNTFTVNTDDDNEERVQMILDRVNAQTFDIIALQEVMDDTQREQLCLGISPHDSYLKVWGPNQDSYGATVVEDSGLTLLFRSRFTSNPQTDPVLCNPLLLGGNWFGDHHSEEFTSDCEGWDCFANKGFTVSRVDIGPSAYLYVVNTHLQAGEDSQVHPAIRASQLTQIATYVRSLPETHPVLLMGDLNMTAGGAEYLAHVQNTFYFLDTLFGWEDAVETVFGSAAQLFTDDKTRNAYGHFWDDHIGEHVGEDIFCNGACNPPVSHPWEAKRNDYIMIRQGTDYRLVVESVQLEDSSPAPTLCRDEFGPQFQDPGHGNLRCYLSDHFGLSAELRLAVQP